MEKTIFSNINFKIILAVGVGFLLFFTAVIKIAYPSEALFDFYIALGIFELGLAVALIAFAKKWQAWAFLAVVFAAWTGYSLYSTIFGLPCPCFGSAITLPRGSSLAIDGLVLVPAWALLLKDRRFSSSHCSRLIWASVLFLFLGFCLPEILYNIG